MDLLDSLSTHFLCFQSICLLLSIFPCFVLIYLDLLCGSLHCVQGCYHPDFLNAWDNFDQQKGSENDRPGERVEYSHFYVFSRCPSGDPSILITQLHRFVEPPRAIFLLSSPGSLSNFAEFVALKINIDFLILKFYHHIFYRTSVFQTIQYVCPKSKVSLLSFQISFRRISSS